MVSADDHCPGIERTHPGADGHVARIRLPGGWISPDQLRALNSIAGELGDGYIDITGRANIQLRGLTADFDRSLLMSTGLLPSIKHDRVRNILVSPTAGRYGSRGDVRGIAGEYDKLLLASSILARLPGRFLAGCDDGHGDVLRHRPDVGVFAHSADVMELIVGGVPTGRGVSAVNAAAAIIEIAGQFMRVRGSQWRVSDLGNDAREVLDEHVVQISSPLVGEPVPQGVDTASSLIGWFEQDDGLVMVGAALRHGRLSARLGEVIAAAEHPIILTPHRGIMLCDLTEDEAEAVVRVLAPMDAIFDVNSPWIRVSSCTGLPGCAKSHRDVRGDLDDYLSHPSAAVADRQHWVGCERACGAPHGKHTLVIADDNGYRNVDKPG